MDDRHLELEIEIAAAAETAWRALTDAEGLIGWFASDARVDLQPGGEWYIAHGDPGMTSTVAAVEEGRSVKVVTPEREGIQITSEFAVEGRGGMTVVRISESGFGPGADWDAEIRSRISGWTSYLENLRHYLEHHAADPALCNYLQTPFAGTGAEAWDTLAGLLAATFPGAEFERRPPNTLAARVPELGDGRTLASVEAADDGGMIWLQLIAYADGRPRLNTVTANLQRRLDATFAPADAGVNAPPRLNVA